MKILILNHEYPPLEGGAANATYHLAREIAARGHRAYVVTLNLFGGPSVRRDGRVVEIRLPFKRSRAGAFNPAELVHFCVVGAWATRRLLRRLRVDLVHAFFAFPEGVMVSRLARKMGVPCVISLRGSDVPGFRQGLLASATYFLVRPFLRASWRWAHCRAVANSEDLRRLALRTAPAGRIDVIPNGVDCERFVPADRSEKTAGRVELLTVGQLIPRKRIDLLIDMLPELRKRTAREVHLTVVGRGPMRDELMRQAESRGVPEAVSFEGHVPPAEMPAVYQRSDLFVLASMQEGMPNAVMEALACGLPVVSSKVGGMESVIGQGVEGYVVGEPLSGELAERTAELVADEEKRRDMGRKAREKAVACSWGSVAEAYLEVYKDLRAGQPGVRAGAVQKRFDQDAAFWDSLYVSRPRDIIADELNERMRETLELSLRYAPADARVLDVGCGTGGLLAALVSQGEGRKGKGVDLSRAMIETCRKRYPSLEFEVADVEHLNLGKEPCDVAVCMGVLGYLNNPEQVVRRACRALKPGGIFVFQFSNFWSPFHLVRAGIIRIARIRFIEPLVRVLFRRVYQRDPTGLVEEAAWRGLKPGRVMSWIQDDCDVLHRKGISYASGLFGPLSVRMEHALRHLLPRMMARTQLVCVRRRSAAAPGKAVERKLNVAIVSVLSYPLFDGSCKEKFGGAEVQSSLIARGLAARGHDVSVITFDHGQPKGQRLLGVWVVKSVPPVTGTEAVRGIFSQFRIYRTIRELDPDVIMQPSATGMTFTVALYALLHRKKAVSLITSDKDIAGKRTISWIERPGFEVGLRMCDAILVRNEFQEQVARRIRPRRSRYIQLMSTACDFPQDMDDADRRHVLWVGRCIPLKRPEVFVEMARRIPDTQFLMIAPPQDRALFDRVAAQADELSNLTVLPRVAFQEMAQYYRRATMLVNTSEFEGFPTSFMEAASWSCPIISLLVNPSSFLTEKGAGIVCEDDQERLFREVGRLARDAEARKSMGERAREYVREHNDMVVVAGEYEDVFMRLTSSST